jgi:hypothetical protein
MVYRLYRRDPVLAGNWYYTTPCKGCGSLLYLLDDPSQGRSPAKLMGDGLISVGCLRCGHEDLYHTSEITVCEAKETLSGARPERVPVEKSSRKPLMRSHSAARATFGVGYVEDRPQAAAIIGRIITSWSDIEVQCARLLSELMETNAAPAIALFSSLRSSRAQFDGLEAVANVVLNEADFDLFSAYMVRRSSLEKERNDLAHGCYGVAITIPNGIVWVSQADYIKFSAEAKASPDALEHLSEQFRQKQFVYEYGTLERIAQEIEEYFNQLGFFTGYLYARRSGPHGSAFRAQRYPQLCSQPHIQQALDRVRTAKKASQARPKENHAKTERKRR